MDGAAKVIGLTQIHFQAVREKVNQVGMRIDEFLNDLEQEEIVDPTTHQRFVQDLTESFLAMHTKYTDIMKDKMDSEPPQLTLEPHNIDKS